jgi:hypothetical protein
LSADVVSLRPGIGTESERKALFLEAAAHSFDLYVNDYGAEPDSIVYVYGGLKQTARVGWAVQGASEGGMTSMLAFAQAVIIREICNPDGEA